MTKDEIVKSWLLQAKKHVETAQDMCRLKHYDWCLFMWHLVIEKALKAKIISLGKEPLYIHTLLHLAKFAEYGCSPEEIKQFNEITTYNLEARYDDYKRKFYKKATREYTMKWSKICKDIYKSILNSI